ncbi:DUF167 domain-containing protein [Leptospira borgpetersenii]|uniref:UPF0235 protein LBJ_1240 n=3 Tax=Leptospira borgpetersenii serovar Hardjo-bovis TaxID=338217 RepID=Y1240_LEPBJ|nr:DUF167 domain-containing protein [Leptospira borgpetersenii]Q04TD1.1 RecName: Full=UPF0235 protein LBJ_1240 [Leptospira borgpetersenii serovar Hardjo-bovis str. JB197]Q052F7.1 RecName: Full=UPF0235 protein LBL_1291 [Leptospira borgpetersenii serovar Hardjo-bovis str. L550]ABJ75839.1 Conserved hypothetical protein [Leptospira borgpetersenii serovar Hardjo-bovis str. JB197]ABJ78788.1 Conserved hypothetical protein [Leptospira borgpetersenii serovar Hardjo-bovis str. L550]AMX58057.1 hypothetic
MKFTVRVKPNSKKIFFRKEEDGSVTIAVREPALEGKANEAVIETISREMKIPKRKIRIVSGEKGKKKTIEIDP